MPTREYHMMNITTSSMLRFFGVIIALVALYFIRDIIFALIFAVIAASALEPSVQWFMKRGLARILSVMLVYVMIAGLVAFLAYLILPLLFEQVHLAISTFSRMQDQLARGIEQAGGQTFGSFFQDNAGTLFRIPSEYIGRLSSGVFGFTAELFGGVFSFLLVAVFSFYLTAQEKGIESFLRIVTPLAHEPYVIDLWDRAQRKLGRWLRAQLLLGAVVGVFIFIGLTMLGVEQAFLFAIMAAIFEIIPVVGPILAAIPAVIAALLVSPVLGVSVIALYVIIQQTESHVIVPIVMRKTVGLSPLIVVVALLVGAKLGGIFGILLAVPLTAVGAEFLNDWDKKKRAFLPE